VKNILRDISFLTSEINKFKFSMIRKAMIDGERYYLGLHDILKRTRIAIGENGELNEVHNIPNNRIVDNQYRKMVNQKVDYLLAKPLTIECENKTYLKLLKSIFNKRFQRIIKNIAEDSLNCGIGFLFVYYNELGELSFKRFKPFEVIPHWLDSEHTELEYLIRFFNVEVFKNGFYETVEKVEVYSDLGIDHYEFVGGNLKLVEPYHTNYLIRIKDGVEHFYNWYKIPIIPFKYNHKEIPLIKMVKTLQDGLNLLESNFQNQMEEDSRNTILIIKNYDGENLGEFRRNLATYGAVKVRTDSSTNGGVDSLHVEVNSENYRTILEIFKKAIIENSMGYDAKDDRLSGTPNQMNILSMYSDIDLDTNSLETEFQASFEELLWFINVHFNIKGLGNFENEVVEFIFNRDILISESEAIENCVKSMGILSNETILAQHPWISDVELELVRLEAQKDKELDSYGFEKEEPEDE